MVDLSRVRGREEPDFEDDSPDESQPLRDLLTLDGQACRDCGVRSSAHEIVSSIALGFKNAPRCLSCLARGLGRDPDELRAQLTEFVNRRECYRRAWREADRLEAARSSVAVASPSLAESSEPPSETATEWDAGSMACGELVLALRLRLKDLPAGTMLRLRATDPAAPEDIPAWCRLTGHTLLSAFPPDYQIQRRED